MPYFQEARNVELSLLDYIETQINTNWTDITTVKSFKTVYSKDVKLPIISIELSDTTTTRLEVGSTTLYNKYLCVINIFATSNGQRNDLAYYIKDKLKDGWAYSIFSHVSGDKSTLDKTASGRCNVVSFVSDAKLDFGGGNIDKKDRFRHSISVLVRKSS